MTIGTKNFAELLREVIDSKHGDRLPQEELDKAVNTAKGIHKMEKSEGGLSAGRDGQARVLEDKYGIDYETVKRGAKALRTTGELQDSEGTEAGDTEVTESELSHWKKEIRDSPHEPSELAVAPKKLVKWAKSLQEDIQEETGPGENPKDIDLAIVRKDEWDEFKAEKERLAREIDGQASDELSELSLPALKNIRNSTGNNASPDPKSRYKKEETVSRGDRDRASQLQEQLDFLEGRNSILAEKRRNQIENELAELRGT